MPSSSNADRAEEKPSSAEYKFVRKVLDAAEEKCAKENYTLEAGIAAAFFEVSGPVVDAALARLRSGKDGGKKDG